MNDITVLPSRRTAFMFSKCFDSYEILDMIRNASDSNVKITFSDINEDVTLVIERTYNTEYFRGDFLTISANNAEFIGGKFNLAEPFDELAKAVIFIAGHKRSFMEFIAQRADAIYELTGKSIYIKDIIYIDNCKNYYENSAVVSLCIASLNCMINNYIRNRWDFMSPKIETSTAPALQENPNKDIVFE